MFIGVETSIRFLISSPETSEILESRLELLTLPLYMSNFSLRSERNGRPGVLPIAEKARENKNCKQQGNCSQIKHSPGLNYLFSHNALKSIKPFKQRLGVLTLLYDIC